MNDKKHMEDILYYFEKYHYENMILDDNEAKFIHDYIINLQSKINKAIELIEKEDLIAYFRETNDLTLANKFEDLYKDLKEVNNAKTSKAKIL